MFRGETQDIIAAKMKDGLSKFGTGDEYQGVTDTWNAIQSDFSCCGVSTFNDWKNTTYGKDIRGVPDTCCKTAVSNPELNPF